MPPWGRPWRSPVGFYHRQGQGQALSLPSRSTYQILRRLFPGNLAHLATVVADREGQHLVQFRFGYSSFFTFLLLSMTCQSIDEKTINPKKAPIVDQPKKSFLANSERIAG